MTVTLLRTDKETLDIYTRHMNTVYRVCFTYMKNTADTEDAVQDTFVKLIRHEKVFENAEHEKAWLIKTASNICKNILRHWWRKRENPEDLEDVSGSRSYEIDSTLSAVMDLPDKYKTVVYLHYYEGYTSVEIAAALQKPQSTIRNQLRDARMILKNTLGGDFE